MSEHPDDNIGDISYKALNAFMILLIWCDFYGSEKGKGDFYSYEICLVSLDGMVKKDIVGKTSSTFRNN